MRSRERCALDNRATIGRRALRCVIGDGHATVGAVHAYSYRKRRFGLDTDGRRECRHLRYTDARRSACDCPERRTDRGARVGNRHLFE